MSGALPTTPRLGACPRCGSLDVRRVDRLATGGGYGGLTYLAIRWGPFLASGRFEAHICRACGHAELYLANPADLDRL